MKKHFALGALLVASILCTTSACVDTPGEPEMADEPVADDTIYFETVVTLNADGTSLISEPRAITAGEERAQNELRRAIEAGEIEAPSNIAQDFGCSPFSFWLYWRTDFSGNRICFSGSGYADLATYPMYILINGKPSVIGDWRHSSGSFYSGTLAGDLAYRVSPFEVPVAWKVFFAPWTPATYYQATPSNYLHLN